MSTMIPTCPSNTRACDIVSKSHTTATKSEREVATYRPVVSKRAKYAEATSDA